MHCFRTVVFSAFIGLFSVCFPCQPATAQPVVSSWGDNESGELGDGTYSTTSTLVSVRGLIGLTSSVSGGFIHSLALKSDHTVWAWGQNASGQLGNGTFVDSPIPVQVAGLSDVTAIAAGGYHSLALKGDGTVWAWGTNNHGELGDGTSANRNTPGQVSGLSDVKAIAAGFVNGLALKSDGTVWSWGYNIDGELGNGTNVRSNVPVPVIVLSGVTAIAAGGLHTLALKGDGTVWSWGYNQGGQLGNGTYNPSFPYGINLPVPVSGLTGVTSIAGGYFHSLALKSDATIWAWGRNDYGELGNSSIPAAYSPVQVSGLSGVTALAGGVFYSLALKNDGTLWSWGFNQLGELGNGTYTSTSVPGRVGGVSGVTAFAAGGYHVLVLNTPNTAQLITGLIAQVENPSLGLSNGETKALTSKLDAALASYKRGNSTAAGNQLSAFINQVNELVRTGRLTPSHGATLIAAASSILAAL